MDEDHFTDVMNEASGTETPSAKLASDGSLNEIDRHKIRTNENG